MTSLKSVTFHEERPHHNAAFFIIATIMLPDKIVEAVMDVLDGKHKKGRIPKLWDGHTAERIVAILAGL